MTLKQWESNGWLKVQPASREEIRNLLAIVERDLKDATGSFSADWQFMTELMKFLFWQLGMEEEARQSAQL